MVGELSPSSFYSKYMAKRKDYENRAEDIAEISIPYMIRTDGSTGSDSLKDTNAQSFNGRLLQTLKAKMGMALLPPSTSSFKLSPDSEALEELTQGSEEMKAEIYSQLSGTTARINAEIENQQIRDTLFDSILQWIGVGCSILEKVKGKGIKQHVLKNIAVRLDTDGEPLGMCIVEMLANLPEGIAPKSDADVYQLFTLVEYDAESKRWIQTQETEGEIVGQEVVYTEETMPFNYVGWTWVAGDSYHRPYAEDYFEDMLQYNTLSRLLTHGSVVAAKVVLFVDERKNRTRIKTVTDAANGAVVQGRADDLTAFQLQKNFDFQVPMERLNDIGRNLSSAFLMNQSVTRDAERVTAQEIRFMAQELETSSLSGVYSKLSKKVSKWIVTQIMMELGIKFDKINVDVLTGLDALGRSQEAQKLDAVVQRFASLNLMHWLNEAELAQRYVALEGVDSTGLLKSPAEVQKAQEQQRQDAMAQQAGESMAGEAGKAVVQQPQQ